MGYPLTTSHLISEGIGQLGLISCAKSRALEEQMLKNESPSTKSA
jgi:hypothetical protein